MKLNENKEMLITQISKIQNENVCSDRLNYLHQIIRTNININQLEIS